MERVEISTIVAESGVEAVVSASAVVIWKVLSVAVVVVIVVTAAVELEAPEDFSVGVFWAR